MRSSRFDIALVLLLMLALSRTAVAEESAAQILHAKGAEYYEAGAYEQAIEAFKESYRLAPQKFGLLFNIAQAYRKQGNCGEAARFYRDYLEHVPNDADRSQIEVHIANMDACEKKATTPPGEAIVVRAEPQNANELPRPKPETAWSRWVLAGGSFIAAGSGAFLLGSAQSSLDACAPRCEPTHADHLRARGIFGYGLIGVGVVGALVELILIAFAN